ncbi:hypothetical protein N7494_001608 [Penicillium frequentans]|uniref:protein-tyrosine-phosphatase n=1 Tax=Penicillium frequentans TaxID=3151616 RepID=A0AAD6D4H9_9EURO|nr:hypothetical protein N7494_001608 [Penicillium glabrum]
MPVQTSPPSFPDSFPSFMSVYGGLPPQYEEESSCHLQASAHFSSRRLRPHRESISSTASASTESSPTTTISPFDSPSGGDISPSSSPESPSLKVIVRAPGASGLAQSSSPESEELVFANATTDKLATPNCHRISGGDIVQTSFCPTISDTVPPKSSRRRPANLTIQTPTFNKSFTGTDVVPPTPSLGQHSLRHAESSPSLASISSPSFAPQGGMQLPRPISHHTTRRFSGTSLDTAPSLASTADKETTSRRVLPGLEEEDDHIDSRESTRKKDRGYPDGPIRIHDTGVYLYLEPNAEEAAKFDVVINVAKEVRNPFNKTQGERNDTVMSTWRNASMASKRFSMEDPQTAMSEMSFKSAFEFQPDSASATPTTSTPKSAPPEYIHVGWDHNSEILDDLLPLCELIDERIAQGKKVLVHCQLGASRSASLVIAYGLYKNRHMDFNSMYEAVKGRSQWVGPNMSLIYQLTDFRGLLTRGSPSRPAPHEWWSKNGNRRSSEPQLTHEERAALAETPQPPSHGSAQAPPVDCLSIPLPPPAPVSSQDHCDPLVQTHVFVRDAPNNGGLFSPNAGLFSPRTSGFLAPPASVPPRGIDTVADAPSAAQYANDMADPRSPPPPAGGERMIMRNIDEFL